MDAAISAIDSFFLIRFHLSFTKWYSDLLGPKGRSLLELFCLGLIATSLTFLLQLHFTFVDTHWTKEGSCLQPMIDNLTIPWDILHVQLVNRDLSSRLEKSSSLQNHGSGLFDAVLARSLQTGSTLSVMALDWIQVILGATQLDILRKPRNPTTIPSTPAPTHHYAIVGSYLYTQDRGFFYLRKRSRDRFNITQANITLYTDQKECFGTSYYQFALGAIVGFETAIVNEFVRTMKGEGYVFSVVEGEVYNLEDALPNLFSSGIASSVDSALNRLSVLLTATCLTLAMLALSPAFSRVTVVRLVQIAIELRRCIVTGTPPTALAYAFATKLAVFVVVVSASLLALEQLFASISIASVIFSVIVFTEMFTFICLRTRASSSTFNRARVLFSTLFIVYVALYPFGFHALAFTLMCTCMITTSISLLNQFELPAMRSGFVSVERPRQPGSLMWPI